jgi:hypothetical protein
VNENVRAGKITIFQGQDLLDNIGGDSKDINVTMYNRLPEDDKVDLYNKMTPKEKELYPSPKSIYFLGGLKEQHKEVYDRLMEFGGFKNINRVTSIERGDEKIMLKPAEIKRFNEIAVERFGQNVEDQISTDKEEWESAHQSKDPKNPESTQLQERLRKAWNMAVTQTKHDFELDDNQK